MNASRKTPDHESVIHLERMDEDRVCMRLRDGVDPNGLLSSLDRIFRELFEGGTNHILLDMANVRYPNGTFIAHLVSWTLQARCAGGDVHLLHLARTAHDHLSLFSPLTYLNIGSDKMAESREPGSDFSSFLELETETFMEGDPAFLHVEARVESMERVTRFVTCCAQKTDMEKMEVSKLKIAVYEACMNVIEHGYEFRPDMFMGVEVVLKKDDFQVSILDHGKKFDFYERKPYDVTGAADERRQGGFGLYIIERSVDELKYESDPKKGNRLVLVKKIQKT